MATDFVLEYFTESTNIKFLYDPKSYYNQLCSMIKNAKEKVVISCLYIGTLPLEQDFVNNILYAKKNNPDLVVELLLDKQRSLRRENTGNSILDLIKPLLSLKNVRVRLYHSPLCDPVYNKLFKPPYSEVVGTLHMKIYVADSVTVISGANCSTPYFTNRMDRYMVVDDPLFAKVMHTVVATVGTMAYKATPAMGFEWDSDLACPLDDYLLFKKQIYQRIVTMIKMCNDALEPILMSKVAAAMGSEDRRSKTSKLFTRLTRRSSTSHSNASVNSNVKNQPHTTVLNSSRSGSSSEREQLETSRTPLTGRDTVSSKSMGSEKSFLSTARSFVGDLKAGSSTSRSSVSNGSGLRLSAQSSFESNASLELSETPEPRPEVLVCESLSGNYVLTPQVYFNTDHNSTRTLNANSGSLPALSSLDTYWSFNSANTVNTYRSLSSSRSNRKNPKLMAENQYCTVCDNFSGQEIDDLDYKPQKILRRYPPLDGYTRFMVFFQLGFSEPPFRQDELLCKDLMIKYRKSGHSVVLATSYLNFTEDYSNLCTYMLNCKSKDNMGSFYVLTSSPTSNDFNNCTDSKKLIPALYCHYQTLLLKHVLDKTPRKEGEEADELPFYYEYQNPGYTFHHKGIWMFHGEVPKDARTLTFQEFKKRIRGPCAMLIGSSNLSRRSHNKDLEMTVLVETNSLNVLDPIKYEVYALFSNATSVSKDTVGKRSTLFHRILAFFLRQYF